MRANGLGCDTNSAADGGLFGSVVADDEALGMQFLKDVRQPTSISPLKNAFVAFFNPRRRVSQDWRSQAAPGSQNSDLRRHFEYHFL